MQVTTRQTTMMTPTALRSVPLNVVLFGPPGAGKGTQADKFAARHGIPKISTGEILRRAVRDGTELGGLVGETLQRGALVGDDLVIPVVRERLAQPDTANGFVLDGFPRTIEQAVELDSLMTGRGPVIVVALAVHTDEVIRRLSTRGREDDDARVIRDRLEIYTNATEPVLEYYRRRKRVTFLDGNRPLQKVTDELEAAVARAIEREHPA